MHCSIASFRLNNVSSPFLPLLSNLASLRVSYQRLLQTIGVLEAQRTQAILDLETLARQQREALADPISFVEQLQKRVTNMQTCVLVFKLHSVSTISGAPVIQYNYSAIKPTFVI